MSYNFETNVLRQLDEDDYFYSAVSKSLVDNNKENISVALNYFDNNTGTEYYHYFELWITGLSYDVFNLNSYMSLRFVTIPFFCVVFILGLIGFLEHLFAKSQNGFIYLLALAGITFGALLPTVDNVTLWKDFDEDIFTHVWIAKHLSVCIFFISLLIQIYKKNTMGKLLSALTIPIISFTLVPFSSGMAVISGASYLYLSIYKGSKNDFGLTKKDTLLIFSVFTLIFTFYFFTKTSQGTWGGNIIINLELFDNLKIIIATLILPFLTYRIVAYLPIIIIFLLIGLNKQNKHFIGESVVYLSVGGVVAVCMLLPMARYPDTRQIFDMPLYLFARLLVTFLAYLSLGNLYLSKKSMLINVLIGGFFMLLIVNNIYAMTNSLVKQSTVGSESFIKNVAVSIPQKTKQPIVVIKNLDNGFCDDKPFHWALNWYVSKPIMITPYNRDIYLLDISDYLDLIERYAADKAVFPYKELYNSYKNMSYKNPFFLFTQEQKRLGIFRDIPHAQVDFIKKHKIEHLITD